MATKQPNPNTYKLEGFGPKGDTTYTFSSVPTATFKWGVAMLQTVRLFNGADVQRLVVHAYAKTQRQAHEFAQRHGGRGSGYLVGKTMYAPERHFA